MPGSGYVLIINPNLSFWQGSLPTRWSSKARPTMGGASRGLGRWPSSGSTLPSESKLWHPNSALWPRVGLGQPSGGWGVAGGWEGGFQGSLNLTRETLGTLFIILARCWCLKRGSKGCWGCGSRPHSSCSVRKALCQSFGHGVDQFPGGLVPGATMQTSHYSPADIRSNQQDWQAAACCPAGT